MNDQQAFLEILSASFNTGESKSYALSGGYFEILDCVYPVTVNLIGRHGELKGIMRNAEASFYLKGGDYQTITIQSDQAQTVRFAFGTSEAGTRRTAGIVQVVDGSRAIVSAGNAFLSYMDVAAVAANASQVQLWNPGGSGKNLIVKAVFVSAEAARFYSVRHGTVALPTVHPNSPPKNKLLGAAASTAAQARSRSDNAIVEGSVLGPAIFVMANDSKGFTFNEPLIVPPGNGLNVAVSGVNQACYATYDFYEVTI